MTCDELLAVLDDAAVRAEHLRQQGAEVIFLTGSEVSLFTRGFLPGETLTERLALLAAPRRPHQGFTQIAPRLNEVLGQAVTRARARFHGKISYASIPSEGVDWTPFDIIGVDAYHTKALADQYRTGLRALLAAGKPVAITECGCATFQGASARSGTGGMIVAYKSGRPTRLNGDYLRDEAEQATHLRTLLDIFTAEGAEAVFVNTFASYHLPHRSDPQLDLDLASYGLVKVLAEHAAQTYPEMGWEPKAAFAALAALYAG